MNDSPNPQMGAGFPKSARLLRGSEFDLVFATKLSAGDDWLVVYGRLNGLGRPRLGLAVSRKVGSAVQRNRWKRLLRESFRRHLCQLPPIDMVCIPRPGKVPEFHAVGRSLESLASRLERKAARRERESQP